MVVTELDLLRKAVAGHEFANRDYITDNPFNCRHVEHRTATSGLERQVCWKARVNMWLKVHEIRVERLSVANYVDIAEVTGIGRDKIAHIMSQAHGRSSIGVVRYAPGYFSVKYVHRDLINEPYIWDELNDATYWETTDD